MHTKNRRLVRKYIYMLMDVPCIDPPGFQMRRGVPTKPTKVPSPSKNCCG
jgi:hypothetical protein